MTMNMMTVVIGGTVIVLVFALAYIAVSAYSHRKILSTNQAKLEEVEKSERKYRDLFENSLAGMMKFSLDTWEILQTNQALRTIFAVASQEELQRSISHLPEQALKTIKEALIHRGMIGEYEIHTQRKNGVAAWILLSARASKDEHTAQAVIIDITTRKLYEEKIREQSALLDQTQDAIMVTDREGIISYWNSGAELMYGWKRNDVLGGSLQTTLFDNSRMVEFQAVMEDIRHFGEWSGETRHVRKDGKEILVESRWQAGETASGNGFILVVNSDITEKRRMENQFLRAQKMESIAILTGGIAHDLQNILAPVQLSTHLLRPRLTDESSLSVLQAVEESVLSGLDLIKNIMTYGKGIIGDRIPLRVIDVLDQVITMLVGTVPDTIIITKANFLQDWLVSGDANQLKEVFLNLSHNARDAMPAGGILTIDAHDVTSDERLLDDYPDAEAGPYVVVSISDTGEGIPEENLDKIFEPFFTTKEQQGGTGLGLSIAHGIVKSHSGFITVDSKLTVGTTFRVYLPAVLEQKK